MATADELIRLRYPAMCAKCQRALARGSHARWDRATKTATCESCSLDTTTDLTNRVVEIDRGEAGASAARQWKRRHERREREVRAAHRHLGPLLLALSSDPRSTVAWATGARGERMIGRSLDQLREQGIAVLHDRRIPGTRSNIDHLVISAAGMFVIDTKLYRGRVEQRDVGRFFTSDVRLYVGGRDRTKLVEGMRSQARAVREALARDSDAWRVVPLTPALLFAGDDNWPLFQLRPFRFEDVYVLWGKALGKLIRVGRPGLNLDIEALERALAVALRPA